MNAPTVTIERINTLRSRFSTSPFHWVYKTVGPDGRRFDNDSIVTLRSVLKRRYGRSLVIIEPWKAS